MDGWNGKQRMGQLMLKESGMGNGVFLFLVSRHGHDE